LVGSIRAQGHASDANRGLDFATAARHVVDRADGEIAAGDAVAVGIHTRHGERPFATERGDEATRCPIALIAGDGATHAPDFGAEMRIRVVTRGGGPAR